MSDWPKNPFPAGKGRGGNPSGRPVGSQNKLPLEVREIFLRAANRVGAEDELVRLYEEDPEFRITFWKEIMPRLLPKQIDATVGVDAKPPRRQVELYLVSPSGAICDENGREARDQDGQLFLDPLYCRLNGLNEDGTERGLPNGESEH